MDTKGDRYTTTGTWTHQQVDDTTTERSTPQQLGSGRGSMPLEYELTQRGSRTML